MRTHKIAAWVSGGLVIAYCYAFINAIATASENAYQCKAIEAAAVAGHEIPMSVSEPGTPAAFCELGVHPPLLRTYFTVFIYGVLDRTKQAAILDSLRQASRGSHPQEMVVKFYEKGKLEALVRPVLGPKWRLARPRNPHPHPMDPVVASGADRYSHISRFQANSDFSTAKQRSLLPRHAKSGK